MSSFQDIDSISQGRTTPPPAPPSHPADPFLNPRRTTGIVPTQPSFNRGVETMPTSVSKDVACPSLCETATPRGTSTLAEMRRSAIGKKPELALLKECATAAPHGLTDTPQNAAKRRRSDLSLANPSGTSAERRGPASSGLHAKKVRTATSASQVGDQGITTATAMRGKGGLAESDSIHSDEDGRPLAGLAGIGDPRESILREGAASDDDGEGDAEEKALLAAAGAVLPGAQGSSSAATPHPWLVTDAFHVSLWFVLRYAGSALSAADLWACRALLSLTATLQSHGEADSVGTEPEKAESAAFAAGSVGDASADAIARPAVGATTSIHSDAWTWTGTEESELLLRLVLRRPHGFTGRHLELRYGDWLHVQPTLTALAQRLFLWWEPRSSLATSPAGLQRRAGGRDEPGSAAGAEATGASPCSTDMSTALMLEQYDGARVARLVLYGAERATGEGKEAAEVSAATEELVRVMQAVRGTELRLFLTALRHASKAQADGGASSLATRHPPENGEGLDVSGNQGGAEGITKVVRERAGNGSASSAEMLYKNMPIGDNSLYDVIPGRKRDMIGYFVERRYSLWAPTTTGVVPDVPVKAPTMAAREQLPSHGTRSDSKRSAPRQRGGARLNQQSPGEPTNRWTTASTSKATSPVKRCFCNVDAEARVVAKCWDTHVGPVYAPHAGLKAHLVWITEIFHVLTSNGGAGTVGQQGLKPLEATMTVAAPPTLLMVRPQLLLLLQSLQSARQLRRQAAATPVHDVAQEDNGANVHGLAGGTRERTSTAFVQSVPHALLPRWFSAPAYPQAASAPLPASTKLSAAGAFCSSRNSQNPAGPTSAGEDELAEEEEEVICSTRSFHTLDLEDGRCSSGDRLPGMPPPVQLFGTTTTMLQEYRAALYAHRALYEVTDGVASAAQRFRGRNETFVSHMCVTVLSAVRAGVAAIKRHPLKHASPALASDTARFTSLPASLFPPSSTAASPSLDSIMYKRGIYVNHLLMFTPLFRWFACLECLYQLLQSARRYDEANDCLRFLLYEPVYVLHHMPDRVEDGSSLLAATESARVSNKLSPVSFEFRYKMHKRGEWLVRLAQNLTHLKRYPEALALLEEAQAGYHEIAGQEGDQMRPEIFFGASEDATAAALCSVLSHLSFDEAKLPVKVQRRGRLLRVLWPSTAPNAGSVAGDGAGGSASVSPSLALYHAVWEYMRERYCRRHDRLALEKSLAMLHRRVRQWTPLAAHRQLATHQLVDVAVWRVNGVRDSMDYMLWREPSGVRGSGRRRRTEVARSGPVHAASTGARRPALPVELFVMGHFLKKWNAPKTEDGAQGGPRKPWQGCHAGSAVNSASAAGSHDESAPLGTDTWYGAHCEGRWIRCLAYALLWDCYWAYPSMSKDRAGAADNGTPCDPLQSADHELLWLSAFQDGPLDVTTPINFLLRRRAMIEKRIAELERCSREELLSWVAAHIKVDSVEEQQQQQHAPQSVKKAANQSRRSSVDSASNVDAVVVDESEGSVGAGRANMRGNGTGSMGASESLSALPFTSFAGHVVESESVSMNMVSDAPADDEESSLLFAPTAPSPPLSQSITSLPFAQVGERASQRTNPDEAATAAACPQTDTRASLQTPSPPHLNSVPEAWKVPVGSLPLLEILRVVPLLPLWRLLRCLYLSPPTEGVSLRFSGFPDLIFWRQGRGAEKSTENEASPPFCLMEVKSPSDTLSTKQISVNDMLHRCGFQVCVLRVDAVYDTGEPVSNKKIR